MILNEGFNKDIEPIINSSTTLTDWFDRNQDLLTFYGLDHPGNYVYERYDLKDDDIKVLGRMANHCLTVLEYYDAPYKDKIIYAIKGMVIIYNMEFDKLSEYGKIRLYITNKERVYDKRVAYHLNKYYKQFE